MADAPHWVVLLVYLLSAKSARAMMLRVLVVLPLRLVTHTSMRVIDTPDVMWGSVRMCWS